MSASRFPRTLALALLTSAALLLATDQALAATSASTDPATDVHHTDAVLNGHLDPATDSVTDCYFDWGTDTSYTGGTVPCAEGTSFAAPDDVTAILGGLTPTTTYHFRLHLATASSGDFLGIDRAFTPSQFPTGRPGIAAFGPDGTSATTFPNAPDQLAFDSSSRRLYVLHTAAPPNQYTGPASIYGFDASAAPSFTPLGGAFPLATGVAPGQRPQLAVDPATGHLFFSSENTNKVYGFDSSGAALGGSFPIDPAVNPGGITNLSVCGVATDSAGDIWVGAGGGEHVLEYDSSGAFLRSVFASYVTPDFYGQRIPCRLAFDSNDDLYFAEGGQGDIEKYSAPDYTPTPFDLGVDRGRGTFGIAVDQVTHHLFSLSNLDHTLNSNFSASSLVEERDADGNHLFDFGGDFLGAAYSGVASDPATDDVYASDAAAQKVRVFGPPGLLTYPTVTTKSAGALADVSARLRGAVDPEGQGPITDCTFQWGTDTSYGNTAPCSALPGPGSGDQPVAADISGLAPNTTYHFRLLAANAAGTAKGADQTFTTLASPPYIKALETLPASARTDTTARLHGSLDPNGAPLTGCHFDYVAQAAFRLTAYSDLSSGGTLPCSPDPGSGSGDVAVHADATGLNPNTVYLFRLQATNASGTTTGADLSFTTRGPPTVETVGSPVRTATTARLDGRLDPEGAPATFHFDYGTAGPCDSNSCTATAPVAAGEGDQTELASQQITGLQPDTTYHYRIVADNANPDGPTAGQDRTVTTRASDDPLSHGDYPGPPGSDRAWEQVNQPDLGGNPVAEGVGFSDSGERAIYNLYGGTPTPPTAPSMTTPTPSAPPATTRPPAGRTCRSSPALAGPLRLLAPARRRRQPRHAARPQPRVRQRHPGRPLAPPRRRLGADQALRRTRGGLWRHLPLLRRRLPGPSCAQGLLRPRPPHPTRAPRALRRLRRHPPPRQPPARRRRPHLRL